MESQHALEMAQAEGLWSQSDEQRASRRHVMASTIYARIHSGHKVWRGRSITEEQTQEVAELIEDTVYRSSVAKSVAGCPHINIADEYYR